MDIEVFGQKCYDVFYGSAVAQGVERVIWMDGCSAHGFVHFTFLISTSLEYITL